MQRREETLCFFSKRTLTSSPGLVLGLGVKVDRYRDGAVKSISIAQVQCRLCCLSPFPYPWLTCSPDR